MKTTDPLARYTDNHEWARQDGFFYTVGMTDFGQTCLKSITSAELPEVGATLRKGEVFCILESSKAANEVEMPLSGIIVEVNVRLAGTPSLVNTDCYGEGWLVKINASDPIEWDSLMIAEKYRDEIGVFFRKSS